MKNINNILTFIYYTLAAMNLLFENWKWGLYGPYVS